MKFLVSSIFLIALATAAYGSSATWGRRNSTDILLAREIVNRAPIKNNYWSIDVKFPGNGHTNTRTISGVFVYDRFANNSGAVPKLISGGPRYRFATVNLKSQVARGINSTVEIWGR